MDVAATERGLEEVESWRGMRSSAVIASFVTGSVPVVAMCFSISSFS